MKSTLKSKLVIVILATQICLPPGAGQSSQKISDGHKDLNQELTIDFSLAYENVGLYCATQWADLDNDNDLDAIFEGAFTGFLINNGGRFVRIDPGLEHIENGDIALADFDLDGDLDLAISGEEYPAGWAGLTAGIYRNDGQLAFTKIPSPIKSLAYCSLDWGDINNDGLPDLLSSGLNESEEPEAALYINQGQGEFAISDIEIRAVAYGSVTFGDYDKDNWLDILCFGLDYNGSKICEIFKNLDGEAFARVDCQLQGGYLGEAIWGDYDNDGDLDILSSGVRTLTFGNIAYDAFITLYSNEGNSDFQIIFQEEDTRFSNSTISMADADGDGDLDLFASGGSAYPDFSDFKVFENLGNRLFSPMDNSFPPIFKGDMTWGDFDRDGDLDLLCVDGEYNSAYITMYKNNSPSSNQMPPPPSGQSATVLGTDVLLSWDRVHDPESGSHGITYNVYVEKSPGQEAYILPASDLNTGFLSIPAKGNASDTSFLLTEIPPGSYQWKVQSVDNAFGYSAFSEVKSFDVSPVVSAVETEFPNLLFGASAWGDLDGNGYMDLILNGHNNVDDPKTLLKRNNGDDSFSEMKGSVMGLWLGANCLFDYDNDNDLDIVVSGVPPDSLSGDVINEFTALYENRGAFVFEEVDVGLEPSSGGDIASGDVDNDGDLDLFVGGLNSALYENKGSRFNRSDTWFPAMMFGTAEFGDYDADMDLDLLILNKDTLYIMKNAGSMNFQQIDFFFPGSLEGSASWGDFDNDGDLDILFSGESLGIKKVSILENIGNDQFQDIGCDFRGVSQASAAWGDLNHDGFLDIFYSGNSLSDISKVFMNERDKTFSELTTSMEGKQGKVHLVDVDNDKDLDFSLGNQLYRNNMIYPRESLPVPADLAAKIHYMGMLFDWQSGQQGNEKEKRYTYNLRVGTSRGGTEIISPMSDPDQGGKKYLPSFGNTGPNCSWKLDNLPSGTYFWSVQTVSNSFETGAWALEKTFTLGEIRPYFIADTVCQGTRHIFTNQSFSFGPEIKEFHWNFGDGQTSDLESPAHTFEQSGKYQISLTARDEDQVLYTYSDSILVLKAPDLIFRASDVCLGDYSEVTNLTDPADESSISTWIWNFGDGESSLERDPGKHQYFESGSYEVELLALAQNGCTGIKRDSIKVYSYPATAISVSGMTNLCAGDSVILSVVRDPLFSYQWQVDNRILDGAGSDTLLVREGGNYRVTINNEPGNCTSVSELISVAKIDPPMIPELSAENYIEGQCPGEEAIKLHVSNAVPGMEYKWYRNGYEILQAEGPQYQNFIEEGEYSVLAAESGCASESEVFRIDFGEVPQKPGILVNGPVVWYFVCTIDSAFKYRWFLDDREIEGAKGKIYVPSDQAGVYRVAIYNANGCYAISEPLIFPLSTGTSPVSEPELNIYPNPTHGTIFLQCENLPPGEIHVRVLDQAGSVIWMERIQSSGNSLQSTLHLESIPPGVYVLELRIQSNQIRRKILIN